MQMFPLREPKIKHRHDPSRPRVGIGPRMTKSPMDPPMNVVGKIKMLIIHHATARPFRTGCINRSDWPFCCLR